MPIYTYMCVYVYTYIYIYIYIGLKTAPSHIQAADGQGHVARPARAARLHGQSTCYEFTL